MQNPFPYRDTNKIQVDFRFDFNKLDDGVDSLVGDFNTYCMNIAGTRSYILTGRSADIPQRQIDMLQYSFFDFFEQYKFFDYEEARKLLLMSFTK